ncbi:MAG: PAS domain-containing protein [Caulobacteraceae bacterium]|nr:PAS domain-containing protein [Caulobacteraceae bacterium]
MALRVSGDSFVFESVNAAFEAATGLSAFSVIGKSIEQVIPTCGLGVALTFCQQCVETGAGICQVVAGPTTSHPRRFALTLSPVREASGEVVLVLACAEPLPDMQPSGPTIGDNEAEPTSEDVGQSTFLFSNFEDGRPDRIGTSFFTYAGLPFDTPPDRLARAVHPDDRGWLTPRTRLASDRGSFCVDLRIRRSDGEWRWFRIRGELVEGLSGRRWCSVATDVHQLKAGATNANAVARRGVRKERGEQGLVRPAPQGPPARSAESFAEQLALAANGSLDLLEEICDVVAAEVALLDARARIVWANAGCRESMAALDPPIALGARYLDFCRGLIPEVDARAIKSALDEVVGGGEASVSHVYPDSRSKVPKWRQLRVIRLTIEGDVRLIALQEDLTEASEAQAALSSIGEQLLSAQERERQRIAVELHDSTSQHLAALGLGVTRLRQIVGKGQQTREILDDMSKSLQEAVKEVRVLSYLMKPPGLERDGLRATLEAFVRGFGARSGLRVTLHTDGSIDDVDLEVSHAAYRVVQEAVSNVYRHAEARCVDIWVVRRMTTLRLRIADDGRGMARASHDEGDQVQLGVGIPGMRARIAQLGGRLSIHSDGSGTVVTAVTPAASRAAGGEARRAVAPI